MWVAALSATLVLVGCGSGGDDGRATGAKGGYVAKVDPICKDLHSQVNGDLGQDPGKKASAIEAAVAKLNAVPQPKEDSERAQVFIVALNNVNLSLQDVDQSRKVNDKTRADKALVGAKANAVKAAAAAKQYGMTECAQPL